MKPTNMGTGRVVGQFGVGVVDGLDLDDEPDVVPLSGTVTFTPSVPYLPNNSALPNPITIMTAPIKGVLDHEGYLCTPSSDGVTPLYRGVRLFATDDPDMSVENWTYSVAYSFGAVNGVTPVMKAHSVSLPEDSVIDLTRVGEVPSSPGVGTPQALALLAAAEDAAANAGLAAAAAEGIALQLRADADAGAFKGDTGAPGPNTIPTDTSVAFNIQDPETLTGRALSAAIESSAIAPNGGARAVGKGELAVSVKDFGAVGDGITDDTLAIQTAIDVANATNVRLLFEPKVYALSSTINFYSGMTIETSGASFLALNTIGRNAFIRITGNNVRITGGLRITTQGGTAGSAISVADTQNVYIDLLRAHSLSPGAGSGNVRDNGLRANNNLGLTIDEVDIKNFAYAAFMESSPGTKINKITVESYMCGLQIWGSSNSYIDKGLFFGRAPGTAYVPGHNGLLIAGTDPVDNFRVSNTVVRDSGEHGYRLAGGKYSNVWFQNCLAESVDGTGFKALGSTLAEANYNDGITYDNCRVIDAGAINQNTCGFLIQMARNVRINNCSVLKKNKTYSCVEGIRLGGVTNTSITATSMFDVQKYGLHVDEAVGNVSSLKVRNLLIDGSANAVYLQNPLVEFKNIDIEVEVRNLNSIGGSAFYAGYYTSPTTPGTWAGFNRINLVHDGTQVAINPNGGTAAKAAFICEATAPYGLTYVFKDGSTWFDQVTGVRKLQKAGVWTNL